MLSTNNFLKRQSKLNTAIQNTGLSALVLNPGPSLTYITGLHFHLSERPVITFINPGKPMVIVLPELEKAKVNNLTYPIQAFTYPEDPSTWITAFQNAAHALGLEDTMIGVEPRGLRFLELDLLQKAIPSLKFSPAEGVISKLRMYKDDQEITYMSQAVEIAQKALLSTLPKIKIGSTELEIAAEVSMQLLKNGSNPRLPFFPIVSGGPNSANPHASPSERPVEKGDLLVIDYGANVNGYLSDITRTFAIGEVEPEYQQIAKIVHKANKAGHNAIKPGVTAGSVDAAARSVIEESGYGEYFFHRTGHGLGLEGHEEPYIRANSDLILEVGMTFTIEPGIYIPDRNGVRIEDNVVVTQDGSQCLTTLPRELTRLGD